MANLELFQAKIQLTHQKGAVLGTLNHTIDFEPLGIPKEKYDKSYWVKPGTEFQFEDKNYRVIRINFNLEEKTVYSVAPYNCMIEFVVETI